MRRGVWHQCGDKSQKLVEEQLQQRAGVGVIISPRDLSRDNAVQYAERYRVLGAQVLIDQQFYVPDYTNPRLSTYPLSQFRAAVSELRGLSEQQLVEFANELRVIHADLEADAIIAPAIMYEAARPDIVKLNARLFTVAKQVGEEIGIPTYATVVLARSVTASDQTVEPILSAATKLDADGWYFAFEFEDKRIPSRQDTVRRCCFAGLSLACTGKPVLHAYAGPMGLLSFGFGASGVGIGHSQNLWKFTRDRWEPSLNGGGGQAPPRFFSSNLWGTIIYPDETALLTPALRTQVLVPHSSFCAPVLSNSPLQWSKWDANKHLVYTLATTLAQMAATTAPRTNAQSAISMLQQAATLHEAIAQQGIALGDSTNTYQTNWQLAMLDLLNNYGTDFDYLELLS